MSNLVVPVDLRKVSVEIDLTFNKEDIILLLTTGGVGYLAKTLYQHHLTKHDRWLEIQSKNLDQLIGVAIEKDLGFVNVIVHPDVSYALPRGARVERSEEMSGSAVRLQITLPKKRRQRGGGALEA